MERRCKKWVLSSLALITAAVMGFSGCGQEGNSKRFDDIFLPGSGFRLIYSNPMPESSWVPLTQQIFLQFSESVDTTSIPSSIKVTQAIGMSSVTDVTANFTISAGSQATNNDTVILTPITPMTQGAVYMINVGSTLRSLAGNTIQLAQPVRFATGAFDNIDGVISVPGGPIATSWQLYRYSPMGGCFSVAVDYNEDLADAPRVEFTAEDAVGFDFYFSPGPMYVTSGYSGNMRSFILEFPDGGCYEELLGSGVKITIRVKEAYDTTGERSSTTHEFKAGIGGF
jgi:hypothetical protein